MNLSALYSLIIDLFKRLLPVLSLFSTVGVFITVIISFFTKLDDIHQFLLGIRGTATFAAWGPYISRTNAIIPLSEGLTLLSLLIGYKALIYGIRLIKSIAPLIAT